MSSAPQLSGKKLGMMTHASNSGSTMEEKKAGGGRGKEGEKSAYAVFNPGCEAIQGTLTAAQLERELQLRPPQGR